jgi:Domain of unknown function (DUF4396)
MVPGPALQLIAVLWLAATGVSVLVIAGDLSAGQQQRMWIMNLVWPLTALWSGPLGLAAYFTLGRSGTTRAARAATLRHEPPPGHDRPMWQTAALATTHCGAGCVLGDLLAESLVIATPVVLLGRALFGTWLVDFVLAFVFGIGFQYFTIAPMRGLRAGPGLAAALKADTLSLVAWQVGMYGWMAVALFALYTPATLPKSSAAFWFMMQVAMFAGFATSYPVNWLLVRAGVKAAM